MNRIIVTIRIKQKKEYDLELPVNQKIKDLMQDISDSLEGETPGIHPEDTLSFSLPGRPERSGGGSLSDH